MSEVWKDIEGYEGRYQVSDHGNIRSVSRDLCYHAMKPARYLCRKLPERIMVQTIHVNGYKTVWLRRPGEHKKMFVHRLVGIAFVPNPSNSPIVNHKDLNKQNNHHTNLEWATLSENTNHFYKNKFGKQYAEAKTDDTF